MMAQFAVVQSVPYAILGRFTANPAWDGAPWVLQVSQNVNMPQTPSGTIVFAYENVAKLNTIGTLSITSAGNPPEFYYAPAGVNQPSILVNNWKAANLSVTNVSANDQTPIKIQAIAPGIPGITPMKLDIGPPGVMLSSRQTAQGDASPQWMQLVVRCSASTTAILALIGGPTDAAGNNGYVFAVNYPKNSGPGTGVPAPAGYYATTTSNAYTFQFNWGSSRLFVANLSSLLAAQLSVVLRAL